MWELVKNTFLFISCKLSLEDVFLLCCYMVPQWLMSDHDVVVCLTLTADRSRLSVVEWPCSPLHQLQCQSVTAAQLLCKPVMFCTTSRYLPSPLRLAILHCSVPQYWTIYQLIPCSSIVSVCVETETGEKTGLILYWKTQSVLSPLLCREQRLRQSLTQTRQLSIMRKN